MGENPDNIWLKAAGHRRRHNKKCRPFLQHVNEAIALVHKAGVSSMDMIKKCLAFGDFDPIFKVTVSILTN